MTSSASDSSISIGILYERPAVRSVFTYPGRTSVTNTLLSSRSTRRLSRNVERAALLALSVEKGEPELALTTAAVAERMRAWDADAGALTADVLASYTDSRVKGRAPRPRDWERLRELVLQLPAYAGDRGL